MAEIRRKFIEWFEHESPLGQSWMRDRQIRRLHDGAGVENDVNVERARAIPDGAPPPQLLLDLQYTAQQLARKQGGFYRQHHIKETRLLGQVHRLGLIDVREPHNAEVCRVQSLDGCLQSCHPVTQVRAQSEVRRLHGLKEVLLRGLGPPPIDPEVLKGAIRADTPSRSAIDKA